MAQACPPGVSLTEGGGRVRTLWPGERPVARRCRAPPSSLPRPRRRVPLPVLLLPPRAPSATTSRSGTAPRSAPGGGALSRPAARDSDDAPRPSSVPASAPCVGRWTRTSASRGTSPPLARHALPSTRGGGYFATGLQRGDVHDGASDSDDDTPLVSLARRRRGVHRADASDTGPGGIQRAASRTAGASDDKHPLTGGVQDGAGDSDDDTPLLSLARRRGRAPRDDASDPGCLPSRHRTRVVRSAATHSRRTSAPDEAPVVGRVASGSRPPR